MKISSLLEIALADGGHGHTPNNSSIDYNGYRASILPSRFLKLVYDGGEDLIRRAQQMKIAADRGEKFAIPMLYVSIDEWLFDETVPPEIVGHEGRARATLWQQRHGDVEMPVHIHIVRPPWSGVKDGQHRGLPIDTEVFSRMDAETQRHIVQAVSARLKSEQGMIVSNTSIAPGR